MFGRKLKAQFAIEFLISYGISFLIIILAVAVIYNTGIFNPVLVPVSCTPAPGFLCDQYFINSTGVLAVTLGQSTGTNITVRGLACSTTSNTFADAPQYGNIFVTNAVANYPTANSPGTGLNMYTGGTHAFLLYCYNGGGKATGSTGGLFFGYLWLNYTINNYGTVSSRIATMTLKYS